ncbi:MAG: hypothetical protein COB66_05760 [Coxiella sp. (in: Bacteria)]|nr:MAG: hypothetical protein COB66_05760 [Coxiella sp. (in: g-proteobacteria)]
MNRTRHICIALLAASALLLSGCGQTGGLFLPGNGKGYYREHEFTARPVVAAPLIKKSPAKKAKDA